MPRIPKDPKEIVPEFTNDYQELYGRDLVSIILYGSAASGHYVPKKSDINFLIVLTEEGINALKRSFKTVVKWHRRKVSTPLVLTKSYISSSLDTFPIEFYNMQNNYQVVFGEDVLEELSFEKGHLRLQCERELKGKLVQLRQAYLESRGNPRNLIPVIKRSLTAFMSIFRVLLFLQDKDVSADPKTFFPLVFQELGVAEKTFTELVQVREGKVKLSSAELNALFENYIREIRTLVATVDQWAL